MSGSTQADVDAAIVDGSDVVKAALRQLLKDGLGVDGIVQSLHQLATALDIRNTIGVEVWGGTSTGTSTAYVVDPDPAPYERTQGMTITFIPHTSNTGATTFNDGNGVAAVRQSDGGTALVAGDIQGTHLTVLRWDGTVWRLLNGGGRLVPGASGSMVSAGRIIAPNLPKAWAAFAGSDGAISAQNNVASVTRDSTGLYTVTFTSAPPNANYLVLATASHIGGTGNVAASLVAGKVASAFQVICQDLDKTLRDPAEVHVAAFWA
jgi:hypothetical protein